MLIQFHLNNGEILSDRAPCEDHDSFIKWYTEELNRVLSHPLWVTTEGKIIHIKNVCYIEEIPQND